MILVIYSVLRLLTTIAFENISVLSKRFPCPTPGPRLMCFLCMDVLSLKNQPAVQDMHVRSLGGEDALEEGMATHCSILVWRIPQTESLAGYSPWAREEADMTY